jgi:chromosome segregation ATPase
MLQIKVQIAQLQGQQDTLEEHRNAVKVLTAQKQSLKKSLGEATARVEALQTHEVQMLNRIHMLEERAQEATDASEDYRRRCEDAETRCEAANFKVNDLLQVTTQYRLDLEQAHDQARQQRLLASGHKFPSTPSPPSSATRTPGESGGSRHHEHSSLQQRLRHAEAQVDELSLHIRMVEKANEETQLEADKLQVRFQAKLRLAEEQNQDIMELRQEIDKLLEENDRIKLHEMQTETSCRLREIDNQGEIELLQQRVRDLEDENNKLIDLLRARQHELQNEVEANRALKELMHRAGERDSSSEHLMIELRTERDTARRQLLEVSETLQVQARTVTEYHEQFSVLQLQLQHRESEVSSMQKRLELMQGEAQGETRSLYLRLEDLSNENQGVEDALREQKQKTGAVERDLKQRTAELDSSRRSLRNLVDFVRTQHSKILSSQDALAQAVQSKLSRVDARIENATYSVHSTIQEVASVMNGTERDRRLVEKALKDTQVLLQNALDQHDRDAEEKENIWNKYDAAQQQIDELQGMLDDVNAQLSERINVNNNQDAQALVVQEEIHTIQQRLSEAEHRAEQMSTESARAFAKSARTIAYLEGEVTRLKTLLDHLRVVNVKLNGDLKNAHLEGMRCKSLEHRVKLSEQDEAALRKRIEALEGQVQQKEHELLEALEAAREQEEERLERFETDYNAINMQYRALQEKSAALLAEHNALKESRAQDQADHAAEVNAFQLKLQNAQKDVAHHHARTEEMEFELRGVRHTLQETEHLYSQANTRISLLTEEVRVSKDTHASTVRELTNELRDQTEANRTKDQQLTLLKGQVSRLQSDFVQRDEEIAVKLLKRVAADDENRQLRVQLDAQSSDLTLMRGRIEDLQSQVASYSQQCETLTEQDSQSRAELQLVTIKLQEARESARYFALLSAAFFHLVTMNSHVYFGLILHF